MSSSKYFIIRINFENLDSKETNETLETFFGSPSGTCLSSTNAFQISSDEIEEKTKGFASFWSLDIDILNKHYYGVSSLTHLNTYSGVKSVDILTIKVLSLDYSILQKQVLDYIA
jgi:hypothetical protein